MPMPDRRHRRQSPPAPRHDASPVPPPSVPRLRPWCGCPAVPGADAAPIRPAGRESGPDGRSLPNRKERGGNIPPVWRCRPPGTGCPSRSQCRVLFPARRPGTGPAGSRHAGPAHPGRESVQTRREAAPACRAADGGSSPLTVRGDSPRRQDRPSMRSRDAPEWRR